MGVLPDVKAQPAEAPLEARAAAGDREAEERANTAVVVTGLVEDKRRVPEQVSIRREQTIRFNQEEAAAGLR